MISRRALRIPVQLPVVFSADRIAGEGTATNFSTHGFRITTAQHVPAGTHLWVHVSVQVRSHALLTYYHSPMEIDSAVVRWSKGQDIGLEIVSMNATHEERLRQLVTTVQDRSSAAHVRSPANPGASGS